MRRDTTPEAERERLAALRSLPGSVRLSQALELSEVVRQLAEAGRRDRSVRGEAAEAQEPLGDAS